MYCKHGFHPQGFGKKIKPFVYCIINTETLKGFMIFGFIGTMLDNTMMVLFSFTRPLNRPRWVIKTNGFQKNQNKLQY